MHNCKATRKTAIEMVLEGTTLEQNQPLLAELRQCAGCREEYASLRNALRVADQAMQSVLPAESFWSDYHTRLRKNLENGSQFSGALAFTPLSVGARVRIWLRRVAAASIPVPVPIAALLILFIGLSIVFAVYSRGASRAEFPTGSPSFVTKTVEVPVIQEKIITRVVYHERNSRIGRSKADQDIEGERNSANVLAGRQDEASGRNPASLVGFKPTNEVKLTIIKGSYRDE